MKQAVSFPPPSIPSHTDPPFSPAAPHKPPVFGRGLLLLAEHWGGHVAVRQLTPGQAGAGPAGAERDAVFWPDPAVLGHGQKGPLVCTEPRDAPMAWLQPGSHEAVAVGTSGSVESDPRGVRESEVGMPCCHPKDLQKITKAVRGQLTWGTCKQWQRQLSLGHHLAIYRDERRVPAPAPWDLLLQPPNPLCRLSLAGGPSFSISWDALAMDGAQRAAHPSREPDSKLSTSLPQP